MTQRMTSVDAAARVADAVVASGVMAILRAPSTEHFEAVAEALVRAGVRVLEVTMTTPGALASLARVARTFAGEVTIGAGTVLSTEQAEECIDAGAQFLVSPSTAPDVVSAARQAGVAAYPGALTPTEILAAHRSGASGVKLFPASAVGPRFITDVHGPLPEVPIIPTGGIAIADIPDWIAAGAVAVGLGTPLVGKALVEGPDDALATRAREAMTAVTRARSGT